MDGLQRRDRHLGVKGGGAELHATQDRLDEADVGTVPGNSSTVGIVVPCKPG